MQPPMDTAHRTKTVTKMPYGMQIGDADAIRLLIISATNTARKNPSALHVRDL